MPNASRRLLIAVLCALSCLGACSSGKDKYIGVGKNGKKFDPNSLLDAGPDGSGSGGSGGKHGDGSVELLDGALADGATGDDGGFTHETDPTEACSMAQDYSEYARATDLGTEGGMALTTGPAGFGFAFWEKTGGKKLMTMPVDAAGKFGAPAEIFAGDVYGDISLLWTMESGWHMTWIDNSSGQGELETITLNDSLKPGAAMRTTLTNNSLVEARPAMADIAGVPMVAWIAKEMTGESSISSMRLDAMGTVTELVPKNTGHQPVNLAIARMGVANAAVAWVDEVGEHGVWLQKIGEDGKALGKPVQMTDKVSAGNSVSLATRNDEGGAVVYSVTVGNSHEVRFRRLDATGGFTGQDIKLVSGSLQAADASLARLGGGYVVAYRALLGGTVTKPGIRMIIISKEGNVQHDQHGRLVTYPIADSSGVGGRTTVQVSLDGQILISFLDGLGKLHLARQRLDCMQ